MGHKELAVIFRALSDPTRLKLVRLLSGGERCVCELMRSLKLPQPKVSRHLLYLKRAGLARSRKEGLWHHYSLDLKPFRKLGLLKTFGIGSKRALTAYKICGGRGK